MSEESFGAICKILESEEPARALDLLIARYREAKQYPRWFQARMVRTRLQMGLPLIQADGGAEIPPEAHAAYEQALLEAARETGGLFLADGDIPNAWTYLRATGDSALVAEAMERIEPGEGDAEAVIGIALQEGVNPARGLELIFQRHGICRTLTAFGMYGGEKDRQRCLAFLTRSLHAELRESLARAIERQEGVKPENASVPEMIAGRGWLFGEYSTYVDTSHLVSLLHLCPEVTGPRTLELLHELCEYGKRLAPMFQGAGPPPFEDLYVDADHYVLALAGVDLESHLEHFRRKVRESASGALHAQALVRLLLRRGMCQEAAEVAIEHFPAAGALELLCPTAVELCRLAGRFDLLKQLARDQGDELNYVAASLELNRKPKA